MKSGLARIVRLAAIALFVSVAIVASLIGFHAYRVGRAKAWCERVALDLDAWRANHGYYPPTLEVAGLGTDPPALCRSGLLYGTDAGRDFYLDFGDFPMSGWRFESKSRAWHSYGE